MNTTKKFVKSFLLIFVIAILAITSCAPATPQAPSTTAVQPLPTNTTEAPAAEATSSTVKPLPKPEEPVTIAFLYNSPAKDNGYSQMWDDGREVMQEKFGDRVKTVVVENVPASEEATRTIEQLIADGAKMIFDAATLLDYAEKAAAAHPDVGFMRTDAVFQPNEATIYYELGRSNYLIGMAAGLMTKSNIIGYVGGFPSSFENGEADAIALGALSVNPNVKVNTVFIGSWYDPTAAQQAAVSLLDSGADVLLTGGINTDIVMSAAEAKGAFSFGSYHPMSEFAPKGYVTTFVVDTSNLLIQEVQNFLDGKWVGNMEYRIVTVGNGISLDKWGPNVPQEVKDKVGEAYNRMATENWNPIIGPIYDAQGKVVVPDGQVVPDFNFFMGVEWVVKGVNMAK
jgi:basic membrane protein A